MLFSLIDDHTGLTLRELVLEVRTDVREMKDDLGARVLVLELDAVETKAVAKALIKDKQARQATFTARQKLAASIFALVTFTMNMMALGPDVLNF